MPRTSPMSNGMYNPMLIKTLNEINVDGIVAEYKRLEAGIVWSEMGSKGKQAGLQYKISPWTIDPENDKMETLAWTSAVGRNQGLELSYDNLNPFFKDTIFEKLIIDYKLARARFMWINPMSCYSIHIDSTPRIHIPMITNSECYFVFKQDDQGLIKHMPEGYVYWTDTRVPHTFINCSELPRLHLIGVVES